LRQHKLLSVGAGENAVRFLPPLTVTRDEIKYAVDAINAACAAMAPAEE
jgi:acetylornithine/N-succinyldiaminopimelate aminotransferase